MKNVKELFVFVESLIRQVGEQHMPTARYKDFLMEQHQIEKMKAGDHMTTQYSKDWCQGFCTLCGTSHPEQEETIYKLKEKLKKIQEMVNEQAEDPGLWSMPIGRPQYISEGHLQQELRKLHELIEEE